VNVVERKGPSGPLFVGRCVLLVTWALFRCLCVFVLLSILILLFLLIMHLHLTPASHPMEKGEEIGAGAREG
jgi:hypothetical protein